MHLVQTFRPFQCACCAIVTNFLQKLLCRRVIGPGEQFQKFRVDKIAKPASEKTNEE